jgi:hypothetical protein
MPLLSFHKGADPDNYDKYQQCYTRCFKISGGVETDPDDFLAFRSILFVERDEFWKFRC